MRLVVLGDGLADGLALFVVAGVVSPHCALQFWKLADHLRDQIGFGQLGSTLSICYLSALDAGGKPACQPFNPLGLVADAAELGVKGDRFQFGQQGGERRTAVFAPEELGVGQTGA